MMPGAKPGDAPGTRVHVRPEAVRGGRIVLDASETRHVRRVLRLGVGDIVRAMDGLGHEWTVRLSALGTRAEGQILEAAAPAEESPLGLTLAQGIPRGDKLETIIRMSTELGVAAVAPLMTARSIARAESLARWAGRRARWERVAREASKQCGRATVPAVATPATLADWLGTRDARERGDVLVCLWERETAPLAEVLPVARPARAAVVVGPEGGLADDEVEALRAAGAVVAGLGPRLLRTETAGPVAVALLQARWGDLGRRAEGVAP
jgi:16S rRNA (uracil1498-N3)-methyltransferase